MTLEDCQENSKIIGEKTRPELKVLQGGRFDKIHFLRRIEKILPKAQNTDDTKWLLDIFNRYQEILDNEDLMPEEVGAVKNLLVAAGKRLDDLGCTFGKELSIEQGANN